MKKALFLSAILLFTVTIANSQTTFGVNTGKGFNSAYLGYKKTEKILIFIGCQYMNASFDGIESGKRYDYDVNQIISYKDKFYTTVNIYIPNIGVKYYLQQKNKLKTYTSLNVSRPIVTLKSSMEYSLEDEIKGVSMYGGELGYGVEYFFDDNFSLGGEFGISYFHLDYTNETDNEIYNSSTGQYENSKRYRDFNCNLSPTYSRISLNYYL